MPIFKSELERKMSRKFKEIEMKLKNSFSLIHSEVNEMQNSLEVMKKYLKTHDKQYQYSKKEDNKIRAEFRKDVDEFTQKIKQLRLALGSVQEIQNTVVTKKDLAKIEDGIRDTFKDGSADLKFGLIELTKRMNLIEKKIEKLDKNGINHKNKSNFWSFGKKKK